MATKKEIDLLLKGRDIVDKYVLAKTDRSDPRWEHPSVDELNKALEELGFKVIEDFFLYDTKLSFLEISNSIDILHRFTGELEPICDNCIGREPQWCIETMIAHGMDIACYQRRVTSDTATTFDYFPGSVNQVLSSDPILDKQQAKAQLSGKAIGNLFTLNDIIQFWNYNNHESMRCVVLVKQNRDFDFDPFWRLGQMMCVPKGK